MDLPRHRAAGRRPPPPATRRPAPRPSPNQNARHPAASTRTSSRRARGPPLHRPPPPRAHPRRRFPTTQAARRKSTLRRATGRAGDAPARAAVRRRLSAALSRRAARLPVRPARESICVRGARRPGRHPRVGPQRLRRQRRAERHGLVAIFSTGRLRRSTTRAASTRGAAATTAAAAPSGTGFTAIFSTTMAFATLDDQGAIHVGPRRPRRRRRAERHGLYRHLLDGLGVRGVDDEGRIHAWGSTDYGHTNQRRAERHGLRCPLIDDRRVRGARREGASTRGAVPLRGHTAARRAARALPRSSTGGVRGARRAGRHPRVGNSATAARRRGTGFTAIFSTQQAFAALDEEGAIHAWATATAVAAARRAARASRQSSRR